MIFSINFKYLIYMTDLFYPKQISSNSLGSFTTQLWNNINSRLLLHTNQKQYLYLSIFMKIYLIRHAQSQYNVGETQLANKYGTPQYLTTQEYLTHKFNPQLFDASITEEGIIQCLSAHTIMKDVDIDIVIVSPFRRALQTAYEVFKDHKSKPKFIVDPLFRQILQSVCDIGNRIIDLPERFKDFDFSQIKNRYTWYIDAITDQSIKQKALDRLSKYPENQRNLRAAEVMLQILKQHWGTHIKVDSEESMKKRHQQQIQKLKTTYANKKVAIVSHSQNLKYYVGIKIKNCEVREFIIPM